MEGSCQGEPSEQSSNERRLDYVSMVAKSESSVLSKNGVIDKRGHEHLLEEKKQFLNKDANDSCNNWLDDKVARENKNLEAYSGQERSSVVNGSLNCAGKNVDANVMKKHSSEGQEQAANCAEKSVIDVQCDALDYSHKEEDVSKTLASFVIKDNDNDKAIQFVEYKSEAQLPDLVALITLDLSEPYSIYTYRYFLHNWPHLSHLAYDGNQCVGAIVCKLDIHRKSILRGYIAMLVVHRDYRRCKIGSSLVKMAVKKMREHGCEEVVLETEVTNKAALRLYENLAFVRDKRLFRYYLNGVDAWRLKLWLK